MTHRRLAGPLVALGLLACGGGGRGEVPLPSPLAPGEVITVQLCGTRTQAGSPCGEDTPNVIEISAHTASDASALVCPCFNFAFLNQTLNDLGSGTNVYAFTGFRPGTYQVTGQLMAKTVAFRFFHNSSTSTIGVVPASLQSVSGPVQGGLPSCQLGYQLPGGTSAPANFSFQFTIAPGNQGGTC